MTTPEPLPYGEPAANDHGRLVTVGKLVPGSRCRHCTRILAIVGTRRPDGTPHAAALICIRCDLGDHS